MNINILIGLFLNFFVTTFSLKTLNDIPDSCPIYLTISPISKTPEKSKLEINWGPGCNNPPQWIGVFLNDPSISDDPPKFKVDTNHIPSGHITTPIEINKFKLPYGWDREDITRNIPKRTTTPKCLPYYIASYNNEELVTLDCLKIQPNWMLNNNNIGDIALKDIFLPGTHCSGCYYNRTALKGIVLKKFGITQNFDIWTQLVMGIRYLDLSIGYEPEYNNAQKFWIMNDNIRVTKLESILNDIRKFIIYSGEVVIIEFNDFPSGMYKNYKRHDELIEYLEKELSDIVYRSTYANYMNSFNLTINAIRKTGKTLVLTYNHETISQESDLVWSTWKKYTTKYLKTNEYSQYLRNLYSRKLNRPTDAVGNALIAIQGFESSYSPSSPLLTVRERANNINREIISLIGGPWSFNINVIAVDFFMSTNLIDVAVYTNNMKNLNTTFEIY